MESWPPNPDFGQNHVFAVREQHNWFRYQPIRDSNFSGRKFSQFTGVKKLFPCVAFDVDYAHEGCYAVPRESHFKYRKPGPPEIVSVRSGSRIQFTSRANMTVLKCAEFCSATAYFELVQGRVCLCTDDATKVLSGIRGLFDIYASGCLMSIEETNPERPMAEKT